MSTADAQPEAPLAMSSLQGLSNEVCLAVVEHLDMSSFLALSLTSHHFHKLTNLKEEFRRPLLREFTFRAQTLPQWQKDRKDGFACSICLKLLPRIEFTDTQTKGPRGRNGGDQINRFCIPCGVKSGRFSPGSIVKQGDRLRVVCWQCKDVKGGRFCSICFICTDCVRRHSRRNHGWRPCEERPFHNIIGDELPPAEESQTVTAFQISSHPSLSLAVSMSDYKAKTGESASPEWYDDPEDI